MCVMCRPAPSSNANSWRQETRHTHNPYVTFIQGPKTYAWHWNRTQIYAWYRSWLYRPTRSDANTGGLYLSIYTYETTLTFLQ